jgi:hypothetical protein
MPYSVQVAYLLKIMGVHFAGINRDKELTDADKKQLKEFYLDNFIAPRARKLLQKRFPEDFAADPRVEANPENPSPSAQFGRNLNPPS